MTSEDSEKIKALSIQILQTFYLLPYIEDVDFYEQFYQRLSNKNAIQTINIQISDICQSVWHLSNVSTLYHL